MKPTLEIVYRGTESSDSLNEAIEQKLEKLEHYTDKPLHAHVVIDIPHRHQKKGDIFNVSVDLTINGQKIAVSHTDKSAYDAASHVFDVFQRKIKELKSHKKSQRHVDNSPGAIDSEADDTAGDDEAA